MSDVDERLRKLKQLTRAGVPRRYLGCSIDGYKPATDKQRAAVSQVERFLGAWCDTSTPSGLFLIGPPGVGKTHLAAALLLEIASGDTEEDEDFAFVRWRDFEDACKNWPKRDTELFDRWALVCALVLDDLQPSDEATCRGLDWLIDRRYCDCSINAVIVTTNLTVPEIQKAIGDRTFDRLREGARLVPFDGKSYRGRFGWEGKEQHRSLTE